MSRSVPRKTVVVGSGTMGPGMALMMARAGSEVVMVDLRDDLLERAAQAVDTAANLLVQAEIIAEDEPAVIKSRISYTTSLADAARDADFVLEAVPERLDVKQQVFEQLEGIVAKDTILASNTSGIPITKLQVGRSHPGRIVGMHWSNPPHVIPLIEVIRGEKTEDHVAEFVRAFTEEMGYVPVTVKKDVEGFVENRILYAIMREALHLLEEGVASAEDIDLAVQWGIGFKLAGIGPLALLDVAGLDIYHSVASYLNAQLNSRTDVSSVITERVKAGTLGFKTGEGLFSYEPGEIPELMKRRVGLWLRLRKEIQKRG